MNLPFPSLPLPAVKKGRKFRKEFPPFRVPGIKSADAVPGQPRFPEPVEIRALQVALVFAPAVKEINVPELLYIGAVHKGVQLIQEPADGGILQAFLHELLKGVSGERHDIPAPGVHLPGQPEQGLRLQKRLASGKRDAGKKRISAELLKDVFSSSLRSPVQIVGLRILTAGTAKQTALHKDGHAQTGTVDDAFFLNASETQNMCHGIFSLYDILAGRLCPGQGRTEGRLPGPHPPSGAPEREQPGSASRGRVSRGNVSPACSLISYIALQVHAAPDGREGLPDSALAGSGPALGTPRANASGKGSLRPACTPRQNIFAFFSGIICRMAFVFHRSFLCVGLLSASPDVTLPRFRGTGPFHFL